MASHSQSATQVLVLDKESYVHQRASSVLQEMEGQAGGTSEVEAEGR